MNIPILILALCECLAVGWVFGTDNMSAAIEDMQGTRPSKFFTICWKYISPFLLIVIFIVTFVQNMMESPTYPTYVGCAEVCTISSQNKVTLIKFIVWFCTYFIIKLFKFCSSFPRKICKILWRWISQDSDKIVKVVELPLSAQLIGWAIVVCAVFPIPLYMFLVSQI